MKKGLLSQLVMYYNVVKTLSLRRAGLYYLKDPNRTGDVNGDTRINGKMSLRYLEFFLKNLRATFDLRPPGNTSTTTPASTLATPAGHPAYASASLHSTSSGRGQGVAVKFAPRPDR